MDRFVADLDLSGLPDEPVPRSPAERLLRETLADPELADYPHALVILVGLDGRERFCWRASGLSLMQLLGVLAWVKDNVLRGRR